MQHARSYLRVVTKFQIRRGREQGGTVGVSYCTPHAGNSSRFFDQPGLGRIPLITRNRNGWQGTASLELSTHSAIGPVGSEDSDQGTVCRGSMSGTGVYTSGSWRNGR